jgi:hypothetical protein
MVKEAASQSVLVNTAVDCLHHSRAPISLKSSAFGSASDRVPCRLGKDRRQCQDDNLFGMTGDRGGYDLMVEANPALLPMSPRKSRQASQKQSQALCEYSRKA